MENMADEEEAKVKLSTNDSYACPGDYEEDGTDDAVRQSNGNPAALKMDLESPTDELERLANENSDDSDLSNSMDSIKHGHYTVNPESGDTAIVRDDANNGDELVNKSGQAEMDASEPAEKKLKSDAREKVLQDVSNEALTAHNESFSTGSRPASAASSGKSGTPGKKEKDPARKERDRDREDRIRQAQVKLAEDRQRKIEEMREQQRAAQENRERQLEARRKKIEELKRREEERRKQVEERRRVQEETDRVKKEAILSKAKERLTRYEQWKSHGRKGGRRHVLGFGSRAPREVCLPLDARRSSSQSTLRRSPNSSDYDSYFNRRAVSASSVVRRHCCIDINKLTQGTGYPGGSPPSKQLSMSTSVLYHKRSPDFSSTGALNTSGAGGLKSGAESMMALNAIPENRLGRSVVASHPPTRHKSSVNIGTAGVKMRDPKASPRKPRPSSVATSMPSFVRVEMDTPSSSRSKSTDRSPRDRSKSRVSSGKDDDKTDGKEKKAATLPRPYDRKKIEERRQEVKKKQDERKEKEQKEKENRERMTKSEVREGSKEKQAPVRMTKSFIERMSVPKKESDKKEPVVKETTPVKVSRRSAPIEAPVAPPRKVSRRSAPIEAPLAPPRKWMTQPGTAAGMARLAPINSQPQAKAQRDKSKTTKDSPAKPGVKVTTSTDDSSETKSELSRTDSPEAKSVSPVPSRSTPTIQVDEAKGGEEEPKGPSPVPSTDEVKPEGAAGGEHHVTFSEPEAPKTPPRAKPEPKEVTPEPKSSPQKAEAKTTPKTDKEREMEEYKAKLAEKRRLAREKAEREAEIERLKQEELQRQEEERQRLEEERQRREEEESLRLAAEARKAEEERLQRAIEAEEKRKKEEAERLEQERIAKEEAEKKAREEAERLEKERIERSKRDEEERTARKKRLEMIMKRVKTDSPGGTPEKARNESPTRTVTSSSSRGSLVSSEDERGDADDSEKDEKPEKAESGDEAPKFKSPLLQKLTEGRTQNGDSGTPKFKSPLLQSLMGKTKIGARLSGTKLDEMVKSDESLSKSEDNLSKSEDNLSSSNEDLLEKETTSTEDDKETEQVSEGEMEQVSESETEQVSEANLKENGITNGVSEAVEADSEQKCDTDTGEGDVLVEEGDPATRTDLDSPEAEDEDTVIGGESRVSGDVDSVSERDGVTDSSYTAVTTSTADSAVSLSFNGVTTPQNGEYHIEPRDVLVDSKELVDSSISMRTADSFGSSQTGSMGESLVESDTLVTSEDNSQFEEIIDLNVTNGVKSSTLTDSFLNNHADDVINLNNIAVDTTSCDATSHPNNTPPFIAFEENAASRRQDVPDLLS